MTTYNTKNPIGSSDAKDLFDNAQNLDEFVNSNSAQAWNDRLGQQRKTWHGIELQAQIDTGVAASAATVLAQQYRDDALAAAGAIGPLKFFPTKAAAVSALGTYANGDLVEIAQDESRDSSRTRYRKTAGALVFEVNLDWLLIKISQPAGDFIVGGFDSYARLRAYAGSATRAQIIGSVGTAEGPGIFGEFLRDNSDTTTPDNSGTVIIDASGRRWKRVISGPIKPEWFGVSGAGDETSKIQKTLDASAGRQVEFVAGRDYRYTQLTVQADTTVRAAGARFVRISASTGPGVIVRAGVQADAISISTPGGTGGDKGVLITGSGVSIGMLSVIATSEGNQSSNNWAVEVEGVSGAKIEGLSIGSLVSKKMSTGLFAKNVSGFVVGKALIERYRIAVYLKDIENSEFSNFLCRYLGAAVNGKNGENGLLLESSIASGSSHHITFNAWDVQDAGEHSYRVGGELSVKDIEFNGCTSIRSGSSILSGNLSNGGWTGGSGFKILGGDNATGQFHENITFNECGVSDVNMSFGGFPSGHGINNYGAYVFAMGKNIRMNSCWIRKRNQTYGARDGLITKAITGLYLDNCSFRDVELSAIRPIEETPVPGNADSHLPLVDFHINGGVFEVKTPTVGDGICFYFIENTGLAQKNWSMRGVQFIGGAMAMRIADKAAGSFTNLDFEFNYSGSNVNETTYGTAPVVVSSAARIDMTAPWRPAASTIAPREGSRWTDASTGLVRQYMNGQWFIPSQRRYIFIANTDTVTTIPTPLECGHVAVSSNGVNAHLFGWFKAAASPTSLKYNGPAASTMVNTSLTGTTGAAGSMTVGVQTGALQIENRSGSRLTFTVNFLA